MKCERGYLLGLLIASIVFPLTLCGTSWVMPSLDRRYDQTCFLGSHNAYAAQKEGYIYANQYRGLKDQLEIDGARALELDLEKRCWKKLWVGAQECTISLCHQSCTINMLLQPSSVTIGGMGGEPNTFSSYALKVVKEFLDKYSQEIITLHLENRVHDAAYLDSKIEEGGVVNYVLKPSDWDVLAQNGWPTLQWMVDHNKRLVIFNDASAQTMGYSSSIPLASSKYTFFEWQCMAENMYGRVNVNEAAVQRSASAGNAGTTRYLLDLVYFPDGAKILGNIGIDAINILKSKGLKGWVGDYGQLNSVGVNQLLNRLLTQGLENGYAKGRYPNCIKLDFINEGDPMAIVNKINKMADDPAMREQMFKPLIAIPST